MEFPQILQIRGSSALIYTDTSYFRGSVTNRGCLDNFGGKSTYSGTVTSGVQKRIRKAVSIFVQRSKKQTVFNPVTNQSQNFKFGFLTLTIPDVTTLKQSHYYKILLKPYLRILKSKFGVEDYIWKAEIQKRGSIHYHLTINKFVPFYRLRDIWNELLDKNNCMESFKTQYNRNNPNSIDIHSVKNVGNIEAYLTKYISKEQEGDTKLIGKVWGSSDTISNVDYCKVQVTASISEDIKNAQSEKKIDIIDSDYCTIVRLRDNYNWQSVSCSVGVFYKNWLQNPKGALPPPASLSPPPQSAFCVASVHQKKSSVIQKQVDLFAVESWQHHCN